MRYCRLVLLLWIVVAGCKDACPGLQRAWYLDADGDGYSDGVQRCAYVRPDRNYYRQNDLRGTETDCDDSDPLVNPGLQEDCNDGKDNNCDGVIDNCSTQPPAVWQPAPGTSWQWQLSDLPVNTGFDVDMYDIDLFESEPSLIQQLHGQGRKVICYISAGSWENFRPDAGQFPASVQGLPLAGWPGERWLDIRQISVLGPIMQSRMDIAVQKGCDGIEPDNIDGYTNYTGFPLTAADQLQYNSYIAQQAHSRGLSVGLKNDVDQVAELVPYFDWALNESCFDFDECDKMSPFVQAGKAVFGAEYELQPSQFCAEANALNFDFIKKNRELDAAREACR